MIYVLNAQQHVNAHNATTINQKMLLLQAKAYAINAL
jgi:hypothetical protein